jgi:phosphohistidine phosphatase
VRSLILFRHGKSDWGTGEADVDRPLAGRGRRAVRLMGRFLAASSQVPDAVITSPAARATQTLRLAMNAGGWSCPVEEHDHLYGEGVSSLLHEMQAQTDGVRVLLAVGHQPTWSDAVTAFTGGHHVNFPTAAMARIDFAADTWTNVLPGTGVLTWLVTPRLLERL